MMRGIDGALLDEGDAVEKSGCECGPIERGLQHGVGEGIDIAA